MSVLWLSRTTLSGTVARLSGFAQLQIERLPKLTLAYLNMDRGNEDPKIAHDMYSLQRKSTSDKWRKSNSGPNFALLPNMPDYSVLNFITLHVDVGLGLCGIGIRILLVLLTDRIRLKNINKPILPIPMKCCSICCYKMQQAIYHSHSSVTTTFRHVALGQSKIVFTSITLSLRWETQSKVTTTYTKVLQTLTSWNLMKVTGCSCTRFLFITSFYRFCESTLLPTPRRQWI